MTASIIGTPTKTYDGNTTATLKSGNFALANLVSGEDFTVTQTVGTYNSAHVASASSVTTSLSAGDFTVVGSTRASDYSLPTSASGAGQITPYSFPYQIASDSQYFGYPANFATDLGPTIATGVNNENLAIAYSSTGDIASATVGTYPITGRTTDGTGVLSDYTPTLKNGNLTVALPPRSAYILNPTASGTVTASGNATVQLPGGLYVDSNSASARSLPVARPWSTSAAPCWSSAASARAAAHRLPGPARPRPPTIRSPPCPCPASKASPTTGRSASPATPR